MIHDSAAAGAAARRQACQLGGPATYPLFGTAFHFYTDVAGMERWVSARCLRDGAVRPAFRVRLSN